MSAHAAPAEPGFAGRTLALPRVAPAALGAVAVGAVLTALALKGGGGLQLGPLTVDEIVIDLVSGALCAAAVLVTGGTRRAWGVVTLGLFGLLLFVTGVSILWSVQPSDSWLEANRTLSWLAVFAAGIALVRLAPRRWDSLLGGVLIAALVIAGYGLATKVFPSLDANEVYARLRAPFGYWNAVGLSAALAVPCCLWLGARRDGHAALGAIAYPATGLLVLTVLLSYSRGALLALAVGCAFWFALVPLRLRGAAVLIAGGGGAALVAVWCFSQDSLSKDQVPLDLRASAGHELGILLIALVLLLGAAGLFIGFARARRAPGPRLRHRAGVALLVCVALVPVGVAAGLTQTQRGLGGSISHGWNQLTNPHAQGTLTNDPSRLTAVGSVRARYWNEALKILRDNKLTGVGAGGYATVRPRYREDTLDVRHAHGYVVQTAADLGALGLAASLALFVGWLLAAGRATALFGPARRSPYTPERVGLLTLFSVVVVFGVHSLVDWTWFTPATAIVAMLCAGWLAGRGPLLERADAAAAPPRSLRDALRRAPLVAGAAAAVAVALAASWTAWQPQRSVSTGNDALAAIEGGNMAHARSLALRAHDQNPLSVDPYFDLAAVEQAGHRMDQARRAFQQAVQLQPSNPSTWLNLAQFELSAGRPRAALADLGPALYLDPHSPAGQQTYLQAARAAAQAQAAPAK
ncbi:MAG TPA: O-antigen ligase family protein [Solirubrobacteraceae bacterium]|nr:O-antigen ligase family protein [Solirubrobacteraceae bacterium]